VLSRISGRGAAADSSKLGAVQTEQAARLCEGKPAGWGCGAVPGGIGWGSWTTGFVSSKPDTADAKRANLLVARCWPRRWLAKLTRRGEWYTIAGTRTPVKMLEHYADATRYFNPSRPAHVEPLSNTRLLSAAGSARRRYPSDIPTTFPGDALHKARRHDVLSRSDIQQCKTMSSTTKHPSRLTSPSCVGPAAHCSHQHSGCLRLHVADSLPYASNGLQSSKRTIFQTSTTS
jgi:hypothetical protein